MKLKWLAAAIAGVLLGSAVNEAQANPVPSFNFVQPNPIDLGNVSPGSIPDQTFYFVFNDLKPGFGYNFSSSPTIINILGGNVNFTYDPNNTGGSILLSDFVVGLGAFEYGLTLTLQEFYICPDDDCPIQEASYNTETALLRGNAVSAVPIPAALPLLASGLGALGYIGWRRKRRSNVTV